jgi:hypothetical protein
MARLPAVVVVAAALVLVLGLGTRGVRADEEPRDERVVEIVTTAPLPVTDFLQAIRTLTGIPFVWSPDGRGIQNDYVLTAGRNLQCHPDDLFDAVRDLLVLHDLMVVPIGSGANRKLLVMDARRMAAVGPLKSTFVELDDDNVEAWSTKDGVLLTAFIRVEHLENLTATANALVRRTTGAGIGYVMPAPTARGFVVRDFAPVVTQVYRMIRSLDRPVEDSTSGSGEREVVFQAVGLRHARATDVAAALGPLLGAGAPRPAATPPAQGGRPVSLPPPLPALRVLADERLNQLLVRGMKRDVDRVLAAVEAMDRPAAAEAMVLRVVRLEHVDALGVADTLNQMVQRLPPPWPAVEAHPESNAVILHGPEDAVARLEAVIAAMDGDG